MEIVNPKQVILTDNFRKSRMLTKGCPRLLKMVDKHISDMDKNKRKQPMRYSYNLESAKMSYVSSNRSKGVTNMNLNISLDESG